MRIHKKIGTKERLLEIFQNVNKVQIKESTMWGEEVKNENFDNPKAKDKEYLDKTVGDDSSQVSKYDDGTRYPVEDELKVKDPSLEKMKGDDAPIKEAFGDEEDDQDIANQDEPVNVGDVEPEDNDGGSEGAEEKPAWDEDYGDDPEPEETEVEEPEMALDDIPAGDGEETPALDNEIEDGGIDQMTNTAEEPHVDQIEGGLADDAQPTDFDSIQISKGIKIEMEHTDDPHKALEIAMDHLIEIPDYYDRLEAMEAEAKGEGMESDTGAPEDSLLDPSQHWVDDYAPQNVSMGDDIGEEVKKKSELEEDYPLVDPESGEQEWEEKESYMRGDMEYEDISKELAQLKNNPEALKQKLSELPEIIMVDHAGNGDDGVGHRDLEEIGIVSIDYDSLGHDSEDVGDLRIKNISGKPIIMVDPDNHYKMVTKLENGEQF